MTQDRIVEKIVELDSVVKDIQERMATKEDLGELKDEIVTHIDGFVRLHEVLDHEMVSLRAKGDRHEERIDRLEKHVGIE